MLLVCQQESRRIRQVIEGDIITQLALDSQSRKAKLSLLITRQSDLKMLCDSYYRLRPSILALSTS